MMSSDCQRILEALNVSLHKKENYWRNKRDDPQEIASAVMVAIAEVRTAFVEVLEQINKEEKLTP